MNFLEIRPVRTWRERRVFLTFPWRIYRKDPLWVPPLLPDLRARIDPSRGVFFQRGVAEFFIAWRAGKPVGTICAAEDSQANSETGRRDCMFGFFNFIKDYAVMEALLDHVRFWAKERKLENITGPFNLDYEDSYGILLEGRDRPPALLCGHTPPYYQEFVDRYGFEPARGDNLAFALDISQDQSVFQELAAMAQRVRQRRNYRIRPADLSHWDEEIDRVHGLLNLCLAHLTDFRPWPREVVRETLAPFRAIADPGLILFAEEDGCPVGWFPGLPNLNEHFIHVNGLRYPWNYLTLWRRMRLPTACLTVKSVLVPPDHWGSGVAILLFDEMLRRARQRGYQWMDLSLTSADNPRTPALAARFGAVVYKRYRVYRRPV